MTERITASEAKALLAKDAAPEKGRVRGAKRVTIQGQKFDSVRESERWLILRDREKRGEIKNLRRQVPIELHGRKGPILTPTGKVMLYLADFVYDDLISLREVIEDAKGWQTDVSKMKLAILAADGVEVDLV